MLPRRNIKIINNSKRLLRMLIRKRDTSQEKERMPCSPELNRSDSRSLQLHQHISLRLNKKSLQEWTPRIKKNLKRLKKGVRGDPHLSNIERWEKIITNQDLEALDQVLTGLDRSNIEMREVSPMSGILSEDQRLQALSSR